MAQRQQAGTPSERVRAVAVDAGTDYPGEEFGLPASGARSVAGWGRRIGALFIDWFVCMLIAYGLTHTQYWTIVVFAVEVYLLTASLGTTIGKRLLGLRVARLDGEPVGFVWALVRTLLLLTVIPPLIWDANRRGLHDRAANTIVVRM